MPSKVREVTSDPAQQVFIRVGAAQWPAAYKSLHQEAVANAEYRRRKAGCRKPFGASVLCRSISTEPGELEQHLLARR